MHTTHVGSESLASRTGLQTNLLGEYALQPPLPLVPVKAPDME